MHQMRADNMKKLFPEPPVLKDGRLCLRPLSLSDAECLRLLTREESVYRYLPTFLFEKQYSQPQDAILRMYGEGLNDSLILGIFTEERFCGLIEVYSFSAVFRKVSVGYRLLQEEWGKGIATEALKIMIGELELTRGIKVVTASTMPENHASAHVLEKNGFTLALHAVKEDWGFPEATPTNKWIRFLKKTGKVRWRHLQTGGPEEAGNIAESKGAAGGGHPDGAAV